MLDPGYVVSKTEIANDPFPQDIYRQLRVMQDNGFADYKVGGSAALKLASADQTWDNEDVDIFIRTAMNTREFATQLGLGNPVRSWTRNVDPDNPEREERFHDSINQVLTFRHADFNKTIQLVFFDRVGNGSFENFLDGLLDYPAHVLYEVEFPNDRPIYKFFLPSRLWRNILEKRIPRHLHCINSATRLNKYIARGFTFYEGEAVAQIPHEQS